LCHGALGPEFVQVRIIEQRAFAPRRRPNSHVAGKKFSQVEFVAVIATLLSRFRLKPSAPNTKSEAEAAKVLLEVVDDSMNVITPKMRRPEDAGVVFVKR
jgi:hypothetical protein